MRDDDFSLATKRMLAARAGHVCSCPECRAPTSGPQLQPEKVVTAGDAAHISAASPKGPRYDPSLTPEQRRHHDNGIWLCVIHARIVDQDASRYTVEELRRWKKNAEAEAQQKLGKPQQSSATQTETEQQLNAAVLIQGPNAISISGRNAVVLGPNGINIVGPVVNNSRLVKGGTVDVSTSIIAGAGLEGPGGDVRIEGGKGRQGASGGDVRIGPGEVKAGDGGPRGKGGDIIIKGGEAE